MEARMHPRTEGGQRCLSFQLSVTPKSKLASYRDYLGNTVHHFNVPGQHRQLTIVAESLVEVQAPNELPPNLADDAWTELDREIAGGDFWEMLGPSHFACQTPLLKELAAEL